MDKNNVEIKKRVNIRCEQDNIRIDSFLIGHFSDYSRSFFQKLISRGFVTINGLPVNKSFLVKEGDEIEVVFPQPQPLAEGPMPVDFEVVDIQKDFLVVNKPVGLTVHRSKEGGTEPTLINGLLYRFKEFEDFSDLDRPGIVHRLDKNTSGLLVVARNEKAQIQLSNLFKERLVEKTYLAVVKGHPDKEGKIEFAVGRHPVDRKKMSHVSYAGKPALTYYNVLKYYKDCSLVSVRIVTGRTHQIRVHFAALGHGILGDELYGVKSKFIKRQALHSWKLSFLFKGTNFSYWCHVPQDFARLLGFLNKSPI